VIARTYFKNKRGEPYELTEGQCDIFILIVKQGIHWAWLSAPTRYGKSEVAALALLYLAVFEHLKIPVVAGSQDKAKKIMEYILAHVPDHPELYSGLLNLKNIADAEKLKVSASKDGLRWATGGWIYVTSVNSKQRSAGGEGVVGEGGDVVYLEEAGLIREKEQFSKIVRMPEGTWRKLIMAGNAVEGSVFEDGFNNPLYTKTHVDLKQAVKEGRYTEVELEEKKAQTTKRDWKRYYLVEFPEASEFAYFKPKRYEILPIITEYYGAVDLALGQSKNGSLVGITVIGKDSKGQFYEIESIGETLTPDETIRRIFNLPYTFKRFGVEAVQFQKYFLQIIDEKSKELGKYIPFEGITQTKKKEERIESLEPAVNTGQLLLRGEGILWEHMAEYPTGNLDVLDSLEMSARVSGLIQTSYVGF
jgi:predicted phage terminase large subunit-like protein